MTFHRCNRDCRRHGCVQACVQTSGQPSVPLAKIGIIPLFYLDQNQSEQTPYFVTTEQARMMKAAGRGRYIYHGKAFQLAESSPAPRNGYIASESPDSAASISLEEMQANAGVPSATPGSGLPRHRILRARQKVRAIGLREAGTFDDKAPLAFGAPSWPAFSAQRD